MSEALGPIVFTVGVSVMIILLVVAFVNAIWDALDAQRRIAALEHEAKGKEQGR